MSNLGELLKGKERTIKDLSLYMCNCADNETNSALYCMLLGAGASKSSGIKTAQELVETWREIVFKKYYSEEYTKEIAVKKFKEEHNTWYSCDNEYCSLFGQIYDLPSQRRNFIEREVASATPSIGYLYIDCLVKNNYLNTFFTTNYDDLLEQSLLSYSKNLKRPYVCAHDSSVKNISITSSRPKVVKLHGDFLFENLKAISSETESLDSNTKLKFEEFLKNYGLIVVGYAGNDNSIMDVLLKLTSDTDNEFIKQGLYWCILKSDFEEEKLSQKLIDLLQKEKVYYVLIDNFDSFCAELAHNTLKENEKINIPFDTTPKDNNMALKEFLNNQISLFNDDDLIKTDIEERLNLISEPEVSTLQEKFEEKNKSVISKGNFTPEVADVKNLMRLKQYQSAIEEIDKIIKNNQSDITAELFNTLKMIETDAYYLLRDKEKALKILDEIINYNDKTKKISNVPALIRKSYIIDNPIEKMKILEEASNLNPYDDVIFNMLGEVQEDLIDIDKSYIDKSLECYKKSINIDPSAQNSSYKDRIRLVKRTKEDKKLIDICDETIKLLEERDMFSLSLYNARIEKFNILIKNAKDDEKKVQLGKLKETFKSYMNGNHVYERNVEYITEYLNICSLRNEIDEIKNIFDKYDNLYGSDILYKLRKSECYLNNFRNLIGAINILSEVDNNILKEDRQARIIYFNKYLKYLFFNKEYDKAIEIIENQNDSKYLIKKVDSYIDNLIVIDPDKAYNFCTNKFNDEVKVNSTYIQYTFQLLKLGKYKEIYDLYQDLCRKPIETVNKDEDILLINYSLAKKKIGKNITKNNLDSILSHNKDDLQKAAAYILIDEIYNAEKIIKNKIEEDYTYFYDLQFMPVFQDIDFNKFEQKPI